MTAPLQFKVAAVALAAAVSGTPERYKLPPRPTPPTEAELAQMRAARNEHWANLEADLERLIDALGEDFDLFGLWDGHNCADPKDRFVMEGTSYLLSNTYFVRLGNSGRWYITCDGCLAVPVDRGYGPSHQRTRMTTGRTTSEVPVEQALVDYLDALPPGITESRFSDLFLQPPRGRSTRASPCSTP